MNKRLCALVVLGFFVGAASAQSSVTLFGTLDVSGRYVKADGQARRLSEATDGLNSSQLAFRGVEDLGGGLKAGFTLLSGIAADTGSPASASRFWNRRSTVSLFSPAGELRLGRDYVPTFWPIAEADPFGLNGIGHTGNVHQLYEGTRQDNSIGYFLPSGLGGIFGQAMVSAAEGGTSGDKPTRYIGARIGYKAGPLDVSVAGSQRRFAATANQGSVGLTGANVAATAQIGDLQHTYDLGASWDFGVFKLTGSLDRESLRSVHETVGEIGAVVPFGTSQIRASYSRGQLKNATAPNSSTTVEQVTLGYVYNLSKRTAVYSTVARLNNKNGSRLTLPSASGQTTAGGKSQGAEFGLRHFF